MRATAAKPPCAPQTSSPYRVIANMPQGVPSRFMALQRLRFVRPLLNAASSWRRATLDYRLPWGGLGMYIHNSTLFYGHIGHIDTTPPPRRASEAITGRIAAALEGKTATPVVRLRRSK